MTLWSPTDSFRLLGPERYKKVLAICLSAVCGIFFPTSCFSQAEFPRPNSLYRSGSFPLASCKSWNGTVTEIQNKNSASAKLVGVVTSEDAMEFCERMNNGGNSTQEACLRDIANQMRNSFSLVSIANCSTGRIRTTDEKEYQLLGVGSVQSKDDYILAWQHVRSATVLDGSCASGAPPITEQLKLLCPLLIERLVAPLRNFQDETYWAQNWRVDQHGIYDIKQRKPVISIVAPTEGLRNARAVFIEQRVETAKEFNTNRTVNYDMIFKYRGKEVYRLDVDQSDSSHAKVRKIIVSSPFIRDAFGISPGVKLIDVDRYDWSRLCRIQEGMISCRSPYSGNVRYVLEVESESGSVRSILSQHKVRAIEVEIAPVPSEQSGALCRKIHLSRSVLPPDDTYLAILQKEAGAKVRLADWEEIKACYRQGGRSYFEMLGIKFGPQFAPYSQVFVNYKGGRYSRPGRPYFAAFHGGALPQNWLVHDQIGSNQISLGSWPRPQPAFYVLE